MFSEKELQKKLSEKISNKRLQHAMRVKDVAVDLAKKYNSSVEKASIAALLHDCAKGYSHEQSIKLCEELGVELDCITMNQKNLIHAPLGAKIAEVEFGVQDIEILNAICYHTTGRENMSLLEKIIWISDYIEPERDFEGVEKVRELVYSDIDQALLAAFGEIINHIVLKNEIIHPFTVASRNSILKNF